MTVETWDFRGGVEGGVGVGLQTGLGRGLAVKLRSGLVHQVWFSIELKFNSFELDSEVGRLVPLYLMSRSSLICVSSNRRLWQNSYQD